MLRELSPELGWEFMRDAARWLYDEARHMLMGRRRVEAWGLSRRPIPLGGYIYEAWRGEDPLYRLGMLGYFETKNIGRKRERAAPSRRWATRPARPTWSSTGPTRRSTPSTGAAG